MLIRRKALEFILGVSKRIYPNEFGALLRGNSEIIEEILLIPGTTFGKDLATIRFDMKPIDYSIIGSVHSHPGRNFKPSRADIRFFGKIGFVHLIVRYPYSSIEDIAAYNSFGERIELRVTE